MDNGFEDIVGGKLKEFKKSMYLDGSGDLGFMVTKNNKNYFLGFTDLQKVYVKELGDYTIDEHTGVFPKVK